MKWRDDSRAPELTLHEEKERNFEKQRFALLCTVSTTSKG
jgi:hypothetical protein